MLILSASTAFAAQVDMDYEGELDIASDRPVTDGVDTAKIKINLGNNCIYDREAQKYIYSTDNIEVSMNYPDGIITTDKVVISFAEGLLPTLYRDGNQVVDPDFTAITEPGKYILSFNDQTNFNVRFTIVNDLTGAITDYQIPNAFAITSATLDGEDIEYGPNHVTMNEEGHYNIAYKCSATGITHTLNVTLDHIAPVLKLEAVENGVAAGPVDISDAEDNSTVSILLNNEKIKYSKQLTESGTYNITISDKAGNVSTYDFVIRVYFNFNSIAFIGILILVIAAVVAYIVISRKKLRIR